MNCWLGKSVHEPRQALYILTAYPSGNEVPLCEECCAWWRRTDPASVTRVRLARAA